MEGVPGNLELCENDLQPQLTRRRPGQSSLTTPRDEKDKVAILSGTESGKTLGTPVALLVRNENVRPGDYKEMNDVPRPGHADYTYLQKYGIKAKSGGGRSSARETIGRVAAAGIAEKMLKLHSGVEIVAWVASIGDIELNQNGSWTRQQVDELGTLQVLENPKDCGELRYFSKQTNEVFDANGVLVENMEHVDEWKTDECIPVRCPDASTAAKMATLVRQVKEEQDSIGGTVYCVVKNVPVGWGEPSFDKLEAMLAHAMLSLPATKGFEIGSGFEGAKLRGSQHNDAFVGSGAVAENGISILNTKTNFAGGILGGISSGQDITFRVAIKPVSTIGQLQHTADFKGNDSTLEAKGRHDPCVLPRAVPLVEAMAALVLADAYLLQKTR